MGKGHLIKRRYRAVELAELQEFLAAPAASTFTVLTIGKKGSDDAGRV